MAPLLVLELYKSLVSSSPASNDADGNELNNVFTSCHTADLVLLSSSIDDLVG